MNTLYKWLAIGLGWALSCQALASEPANTVEAVLDNGMKVVVRSDSRAPVVVSQLWYRVGSLDETSSRTGLAHLLEHMMFKGTPQVPAGEFSRRIAAAGGKDNAFTSRDATVYFQQLAADKLPVALELEADRMLNLNFADDAFRRELEVVKEERRWRTDDQPTGVLLEQLYANAFTASPQRNPVIGWMDDIAHMQPEDLRHWYRDWYAPNNATLVVVGDVDPAQVIAAARARFGALPARALPERRPQNEPAQRGTRRIEVSVHTELPYLAMAWQVPRLEKLDDKRPYALAVLSALLDGNAAARLPARLERQQRLVSGASSSYDLLSRGPALFTLWAVPTSGVSQQRVEQALRAELADIARNGVSADELARVRRQLQAERVFARDSLFGQAMTIGGLDNAGFSWRDEAQIERKLAEVTAEQVRAAAASLQDAQLTVVQLHPQSAIAKEQP